MNARRTAGCSSSRRRRAEDLALGGPDDFEGELDASERTMLSALVAIESPSLRREDVEFLG
jgi:hypothetical protein